MIEIIKNILIDEEIYYFLEVKKKMISMYVLVYKLLLGYEIFNNKDNIANKYKKLLDVFAKENKILVHDDLNRSNVMHNNN